jgi:hypothetical protein
MLDMDSSLLQESEVFWTRDTRGTKSLRTALAVIRYFRTWAATAFYLSLMFSGPGASGLKTVSGQL